MSPPGADLCLPFACVEHLLLCKHMGLPLHREPLHASSFVWSAFLLPFFWKLPISPAGCGLYETSAPVESPLACAHLRGGVHSAGETACSLLCLPQQRASFLNAKGVSPSPEHEKL